MSTRTTICIDAGHGGKDPGAVGLRGRREKDIALAVALRTGLILQNAGLRVVQTRMDDRFLELHERAEIANRADADLFLSIHCNSATSRSANGFEVFTSAGQTAADPFATAMIQEFAKRFFEKRLRADMSDGDPDKEAQFAVLRSTTMPAVLFELDFISNPTLELWLADADNQAAMAEALADGVLRHLKMPETRGQRPEARDLRQEPELPPAGEALMDDLIAPLAKAQGLAAAVERSVADLDDAELRSVLGALARHNDINGPAGELLGLCLVEASARFLRGKPETRDQNQDA